MSMNVLNQFNNNIDARNELNMKIPTIVIIEGMKSKSQEMRVGKPMAPLPRVIWRPQAAS